MTIIQKSCLWAAGILAAAFYANYAGLSDEAAFGITTALSGAAVVGIGKDRRAGRKACS